LLRAYFDRDPSEDDEENIAVVATNISAMTTQAQIATAEIECISSGAPLGQLDPLDGFVFSRAEIAPGVPYLEGHYSWSE
jgi:hypothetical protein